MDVVVDPVFGIAATAASRVLAERGRLVNLGGSSGDVAEFSSAVLRSRTAEILGYTNAALTPAERRAALTAVDRARRGRAAGGGARGAAAGPGGRGLAAPGRWNGGRAAGAHALTHLPRPASAGRIRPQEDPVQLVTEDNITDLAVERWATAKDPRLAELMTGLVRHLHDFAREVRLTEAEWMAAMQWLTASGRISDDKREEFILASDVLGLSMLVVQMNHQLDPQATPATVLGPFHIEGSPELDYGGGHVRGAARHAALPARRGARPGRQPGRRRGARRLAGRHRGRLRVADPRHRRGAAAGEVHDPRGRQLLRPHHRPAGLHDPDGRPGRRPHLADGDLATSVPRTSTS